MVLKQVWIVVKDGRPIPYEHYPDYAGVVAFKTQKQAANHCGLLKLGNDISKNHYQVKRAIFELL